MGVKKDCSSPNTIQVIMSRAMESARQVACMEKRKIGKGFW